MNNPPLALGFAIKVGKIVHRRASLRASEYTPAKFIGSSQERQ
jgi:hypothetical protein